MKTERTLPHTCSRSINRQNHVVGIADMITSQGYSPGTIELYRATSAELHGAMIGERLLPADLDDGTAN